MNKKSIAKAVFILSFLFIIILPILFVNRESNKISKTENRYLANFPQLFDASGEIVPGFKNGFESWLNDNIGFREVFVTINSDINYYMTNKIQEDVVIGKEGWIFNLQYGNLKKAQNNFALSSEQLLEYANRYEKINSYLQSKNIGLTITVFPYKSDIYGEFLPDTILKINPTSLMDTMKNQFEKNNNYNFNVTYDEIMSEKSKTDKLLYSKAYDYSHWNNYGAFLGYTQIMNQMKTNIPNLKILTDDDFTITPFERKVYLAGKLHSTELDYRYELVNPATSVSDKTFFDRINYNSTDNYKSYNYFKNTDTNLPKAIVIGDSYVWMFMLEQMAESFSELVFIHVQDLQNLNNLIDIINPDVVAVAGLSGAVFDASNFEAPISNPTAQIISQDAPTIIKRGQKQNITITVKNTSNESWNEDRQIRLCIFQDGTDFGYRVKLADGVEVKPNEEYTFVLQDFQAPPHNETYLEFQMVEEGVAYFGEKERVDIKVK